MKYCPYCGASLPDGAVSFCMECGGQLPGMPEPHAIPHEASETVQQDAREEVPLSEPDGEVPDETHSDQDTGDYDGYYEDVLPPDTDRLREGIDPEMIKRILLVLVGVFSIIGISVAMIYLL